tara:strand:+ start:2599 stop:2964 length:366 start_codon:yes stop_codon:yes gene_type:complete
MAKRETRLAGAEILGATTRAQIAPPTPAAVERASPSPGSDTRMQQVMDRVRIAADQLGSLVIHARAINERFGSQHVPEPEVVGSDRAQADGLLWETEAGLDVVGANIRALDYELSRLNSEI